MQALLSIVSKGPPYQPPPPVAPLAQPPVIRGKYRPLTRDQAEEVIKGCKLYKDFESYDNINANWNSPARLEGQLKIMRFFFGPHVYLLDDWMVRQFIGRPLYCTVPWHLLDRAELEEDNSVYLYWNRRQAPRPPPCQAHVLIPRRFVWYNGIIYTRPFMEARVMYESESSLPEDGVPSVESDTDSNTHRYSVLPNGLVSVGGAPMFVFAELLS